MTPNGPDGAGPADAALAGLAARVRALVPRCGPCVVVAVDGPSGAGKTTLAARLAALVGGPPDVHAGGPTGVTVVHVDDLVPGWDGLEAGVTRLVESVLIPLAAGLPAAFQRWDWELDTDGPVVPVPAAGVVIVEGVGSGAQACMPYVSLLVWAEGPEPVRRDRAIARDGAAYLPNWDRWAAQERAHFVREGTPGRADVRSVTGPDGGYSMGAVGGPG